MNEFDSENGTATTRAIPDAETDAVLLDDKEDLIRADYSLAAKPCDLIMKGGVTSGIVYPPAICKLARRFLFANIGGTSAGAIAAGLTAAAEFSRRNGRSGFNAFATLPGWLATGSNLLDLFAPSPKTKPLFRILRGTIGTKPLYVRSAHVFGNLVAAYWVTALIASAAALSLAVPAIERLGMALTALYVLPLTVLFSSAVLIVRFFFAVRIDIPNNWYGLCTGGGAKKRGPQPLTVWLDERLSAYAGVPGVLTFGHLWSAPLRPPGRTLPGHASGVPLLDDDYQRSNRSINLEMVTTNLTAGRPFTLPLSSLEEWVFYYDPAELQYFFPKRVLAALNAAPGFVPQSYRAPNRAPVTVWPLPSAADFPVIVAIRMSLSFPILFSAVPLYAVERSAASVAGAPVVKHWFSDGGLSSNLPIHFFDRPLPRWPTFGLNLRGPVAGAPTPVAMATEHPPEISELPPAGGSRIVKFLGTIFDTLQNWTDNTQLRMPGYRERVVEVQLAPDQGGLNLTMSSGVRRTLLERGAQAGIELLRWYGGPPAATPALWTKHRFIRAWSTLAVVELWLRHFHAGYAAPIPPDPSYNGVMTTPPPGQAWKSTTQQAAAKTLAAALDALGNAAATAPSLDSAAYGNPEPGPELRTRPRT